MDDKIERLLHRLESRRPTARLRAVYASIPFVRRQRVVRALAERLFDLEWRIGASAVDVMSLAVDRRDVQAGLLQVLAPDSPVDSFAVRFGAIEVLGAVVDRSQAVLDCLCRLAREDPDDHCRLSCVFALSNSAMHSRKARRAILSFARNEEDTKGGMLAMLGSQAYKEARVHVLRQVRAGDAGYWAELLGEFLGDWQTTARVRAELLDATRDGLTPCQRVVVAQACQHKMEGCWKPAPESDLSVFVASAFAEEAQRVVTSWDRTPSA